MAQESGQGWKRDRQAGQKEKRNDWMNGIGCLGSLFLFCGLMFAYLYTTGAVTSASAAPFARPPVIAAMTAGLVGCILLLVLPGRALRQQQKARYNERQKQTLDTSAHYNPESEWDRRVGRMEARNKQRDGWLRRNRYRLFAGAAVLVVVVFLFGPRLARYGAALGVNITPVLYGLVMLVLFMPVILRYANGRMYARAGERRRITPAEYKQSLVLPVMGEVLQNPAFHAPDAFDASPVLQGGALGRVDRCETNDFLTATYRGVQFSSADIKVQATRERRFTDEDGVHTGLVVDFTFRGRWLMAQSRKPLQSGFYLWSKGFAGGTGQRAAAEKGMQPLPLESPHFNEIFDVYAYEAHDVFLFLTPVLMEYLERLMRTEAGQAATHEIALVCVGDVVQVYIENVPDAFEPDPFLRDATEQNSRSKILAEIAVLTDTIDSLYQNLV